jgi:hypothetical protein
MASEHESVHDFYTRIHQEERYHMDTRSFRSFRNPTKEENTQPMTDEQSHANTLGDAEENPGFLTGEGSGEQLAEVLNCDPGDEDDNGEPAPIGEPLTTEGETLTA